MSIYEHLFQWQKNIVNRFLDRQSFGLFLDMGLGKTPLSLAFAEQHHCTKVIVITLNAKATETEDMKGSWLWWAKKSDINWHLHTKWSKESFVDGPELTLINYESLFKQHKDLRKDNSVTLKESMLDFLKTCKSNNVALIIDESHMVKNLSSMRTKAIQQIQRQLSRLSSCLYTYLATGTPFTTGYIDLYTQLKLLGYEETKAHFKDCFCIMGELKGLLGWQQPIVGYKNVENLYKVVHKYALTIKSDDVIDLPNQLFVYHSLPMSDSFNLFVQDKISGKEILKENSKRRLKLQDTKEYDTTAKVPNPYFRNIAAPDFRWIADTSSTFWLRARELSIGFQGNSAESIWYDRTRLDAVKSFLKDNPDNYVLFYNFTPELLELYDICESLGYNVDVYCGEIKSLKYYERYESQTEDERFSNKKNIILANFTSGSTGKNWQCYDKCILFSIPLFKDYQQGIKRIHRIGQKKTVIYHIFYQKNWLDYSMQEALKEQKDYSLKMFESDIQRISELTQEVNSK